MGAITIDYWRALGLLILCRILFGGFRGRGHGSWQEKHASTGRRCRAKNENNSTKRRADWRRPRKTEEKQDD
jgi:hypothetical protein